MKFLFIAICVLSPLVQASEPTTRPASVTLKVYCSAFAVSNQGATDIIIEV